MLLTVIALCVCVVDMSHAGTWTDETPFIYDFDNANNGWRVYKDAEVNGELTNKDITSSYTAKYYHGPFENGKFYLNRHFQCAVFSTLLVQWSVAYCGVDATKDHSTLFFNSVLQNAQHPLDPASNDALIYHDQALVDETGCVVWSTQTFSESQTTDLQNIYALWPYELNIRTKLSAANEFAFVYDISVICTINPSPAPPTNPPSTSSISTDKYCVSVPSPISPPMLVDVAGTFALYPDSVNPTLTNGKPSYSNDDITPTQYIYWSGTQWLIGPTLGDTTSGNYDCECDSTTTSLSSCNNNWKEKNNGNQYHKRRDIGTIHRFCGQEDPSGHIISRLISLFDFHYVMVAVCSFILGVLALYSCQYIYGSNKHQKRIQQFYT